MLDAVHTDGGTALRWAPPHHQSDREVVLAAVQSDGAALAFVGSPELKRDWAIVMAAVQSDGTALYFAPRELKDNLTIQVTALAQSKDAIYYGEWAEGPAHASLAPLGSGRDRWPPTKC